MNEAVIRQATEADVASIYRLQQQWWNEGSYHGSPPDGFEPIAAQLGPYFLVAELDGVVVGFLCAEVRVSEGSAVIPAGQRTIELDSVYVAPPFRNRGLGSSLVTRVLAQAKDDGVTHAVLCSANKDLHRIIRFYERHNFQTWYVRMFQELY